MFFFFFNLEVEKTQTRKLSCIESTFEKEEVTVQ